MATQRRRRGCGRSNLLRKICIKKHSDQPNLLKGRSQCQVCKTMLKIWESPWDRDMTFQLGTVLELGSMNCLIHQPLLTMYLTDISQMEPMGAPPSHEDIICLHRFTVFSFTFSIRGGYFSQPLYFSNRNTRIGYKGIGRVLDLEWIDIRLLRSWKLRCSVRHGSACQTRHISSGVMAHRPRLLIDTWLMCLVDSPLGADYVALSYVWGQTPALRTVQANLKNLQRPQYLKRKDIFPRIPKTIQDAIALTELLYERYLWVDSLCIIQDDGVSSGDEINKMASIYANAALTIVAAEGEDAAHGIRGIKMVSQPRSTLQRVFKLPNGIKAIQRQDGDIKRSRWSSRGWTYQESLFSKRKLVFFGGSVKWECICNAWDEDVDLELREPAEERLDVFNPSKVEAFDFIKQLHRRRIAKFSAISWPDIALYQSLVCGFNQTNFTYPEDVVEAFSGITTALSTVFKGGFFYGLPEMFFDIALLWRPKSKMKRRLPQRASNIPFQIPSWSWMGWHGEIDNSSWGSGADYVKYSSTRIDLRISQRTIPVVKWTISDKNRQVQQDVDSTWCLHNTLHLTNGQLNLPQGWSQYDYHCRADNPTFSERSVPKYFFKHSSDSETEFWYPIPIPEITTGSISPRLMPFISCYTSRCWFKIGEPLKLSNQCFSLRDHAGTWAGMLNIHNHEDFEIISSSTESQSNTVELIVISEGYSSDFYDIDEWFHEERTKSTEIYEFYNVLWISWQHDIASRKGLGRVQKSIWEVQKIDRINITLG